MFKETIEDISRINADNAKELKIFSDWEEKNSYVAGKLVELKSDEVVNFFNNSVDERGDFKDFLTSDNVKHLGQIIQAVTPPSKVVKGPNIDYNFNSFGEYYEADGDYDLIFEDVLPAILSKNVAAKEHKNNLSIITATAKCEEDLSDHWGAAGGERNAANLQCIFGKFINQPNISVLEKVYINYLGGQFNQNDDWYINKLLKKYKKEAYQKFLNEQPDIQKFQNKEIIINNLVLPPSSRRALLRDKFGYTSSSFADRNKYEDEGVEYSLIRAREANGRLKKGTANLYNQSDSSENKSLDEFVRSAEGRLSPCLNKINPLDRFGADGEYIIADLSPEYSGVYSVSGNLEAFFEKNKLAGKKEAKSIRAQDFAEIKNQINFKNTQDLAGFKLMSSLFFRDRLKAICGIDVGELNLRTQYQFLNFISEYPEATLKNLNAFLNNSLSETGRTDRLKSFLCLELDQNLGKELVSLGEKFSPDQADLLFSKIAEINELASKEESELGLLLMKDNNEFSFPGLKSELLKRAQALVVRFSQVQAGKFKAEEAARIFSELENIKTEIILFSSLLKSSKENNQNIDLETVKDLDLRVKDYGEVISELERKEIFNIAQANWAGFGNLKMADVVLEGLEKSLTEDKKQRAYILKYKGDVIGFVRFERTDNETVYAGSFNVSKDLRGLSIGNDLMEKALIKEGESNILEATASIKISAGCSYVEKIGFVADGIIEDYHGTGESLFQIKLDKQNNKDYAWRSEGKVKPLLGDDLKKEAKGYRELNDLVGQELFVLRFDLNSEMDAYQKTLSELLPKVDDNGHKLETVEDKYTLTRYFYDKEEDPKGSIRYLAFEKNH